jgi:two-component system LytT family sensor kinase
MNNLDICISVFTSIFEVIKRMIGLKKTTSSKAILKEAFKINWFIVSLVFAYFFLRLLILTEYDMIPVFSILSLLYIAISYFSLFIIVLYTYHHLDRSSVTYKIVRYGLSYLVSFLIYIFFFSLASFVAESEPLVHRDKKFLISFVIDNCAFTTIIIYFHNYVINKLEKEDAMLENINIKLKNSEANNLLLKQQIHPHFLFNSLHLVKALYRSNPQLADDYLIKLSDFLRQSITISRSVSTTLEDEIKYLDDYLQMQKIRFGDALIWEVNIDDHDFLQYHIPTFSLQSLAENAIKHNSFSDTFPLKITITQNNDKLEIFNPIRKKNFYENSTGIGLVNLAERYQLWSGNVLQIEHNEDFFLVTFKMINYESSNYRR